MFAFILISIGGLLEEISNSFGKKLMSERAKDIYRVGFLNVLCAAIIFFLISFVRGKFVFSIESLPFFIPRAVLEIALAHISLFALREADRSTFGFIRTITIPLLLLVDFYLGYDISIKQFIGIMIIFISLAVITLKQKLNLKGFGYVIFTAVTSVATLSLYKYNITHFNSVEAEEGIIYTILLIYFFGVLVFHVKENPLALLKQPKYLILAGVRSIASVFLGFAYLFSAASVIIAARRALGLFFPILSGHYYFQEKGLAFKLVIFLGIFFGLILLVV